MLGCFHCQSFAETSKEALAGVIDSIRIGCRRRRENANHRKKLSESRSLDPFEKLFGNDLVSINIGHVPE